MTPTKHMLDAGYDASHELASKNGQGMMFRLVSKEHVEAGMVVIYMAMEKARIEDEAKAKLAASGLHPASATTAPGVSHSGVAPDANQTPDPNA